MSEHDELLRTVERQIASLLQDVEKRTGAYVDSISVDTVEVTQLHHDRPQHIRHVRIDLRRVPGSRWET